ncbi:MAG: phage terminase large subunit family protein [Candidatus Riflebacteria bacterium]|nr:phage terminase large subunit family protein [Candidatus Riflebacteria bacterium]
MIRNPYLHSLIEKLKEQRTDTDMAEWVCNNTTIAGKPFSFNSYSYQRDIINDMHPNLCCKKLSQVGITEIQIRKMLGFMVMNPGTRVLYTFPTSTLKDNNSKTRIRPLVDNDFPDDSGPGGKLIRNNDIIQIGGSFLYIANGSESDVTSTPADMVLNDEIDLGDSDFYSLVNSRLQNSTWKIKQSFSTPTFSGFGVSLEYQNSDQREYFIKCPHCGHWYVPMYDLNSVYIPGLPKYIQKLTDIREEVAIDLDLDNAYVMCEKCHKPLNISDDSIREWVATYPSRVHSRGYQIRPFSTSRLSVKYLVMTIADYIKKGKIRRAYNTVLGEEYTEGDVRIDEAAIRNCFKSRLVPDVPRDRPCYIGIDEGLVCHIVVYTEGAALEFVRTSYENLINKIKELDEKYNIIAGAIDRYPYTPLSNDIRDMTGGRIQPVVYGVGKIAEPKVEADKSISYYNCNRTMALDEVKSAITKGDIEFFGYLDQEDIIVEHLREMVREEKEGEKQPEWRKLNGNDHFFHALSYAMLAKHIHYIANWNPNSEFRSIIDLTGPKESSNSNIREIGLRGYSTNYSTNRLGY